jgi:hypothetical protein
MASKELAMLDNGGGRMLNGCAVCTFAVVRSRGLVVEFGLNRPKPSP